MPKVVTQRCLEQDLNPRPTDRKPKCLTVAPPRRRNDCSEEIVSSSPAIYCVNRVNSRSAATFRPRAKLPVHAPQRRTGKWRCGSGSVSDPIRCPHRRRLSDAGYVITSISVRPKSTATAAGRSLLSNCRTFSTIITDNIILVGRVE